MNAPWTTSLEKFNGKVYVMNKLTLILIHFNFTKKKVIAGKNIKLNNHILTRYRWRTFKRLCSISPNVWNAALTDWKKYIPLGLVHSA